MTTPEESANDTVAAANESMLADMKRRAVDEAVIAADQDAALKAVRDECDAFRAKLASN